MNEDLLEVLEGLPANPTRVIDLYEKLMTADLFAIVPPVEIKSIDSMGFLTYDAADGLPELPIFTSRELAAELKIPGRAVYAQVPGKMLWPRLLQVITESRNTRVALNPLSPRGIRLTKEIILGMISTSTHERQ